MAHAAELEATLLAASSPERDAGPPPPPPPAPCADSALVLVGNANRLKRGF
jgi:hypothetical protein